jgi:ribosomal protein L37AE/L43A
MQHYLNTNCTSCDSKITRLSIHKVMTCFECKKERIKKNYEKNSQVKIKKTLSK